MELWETGLLNKFVSDTFNIPNAEECFSTKKSTARDEPIKLVDSTDAFLILGIGLGAGILCFWIELIIGKYRKERKLMREMTREQIAEKKSADPSSLSSVEGVIIEAENDEKHHPSPITSVSELKLNAMENG